MVAEITELWVENSEKTNYRDVTSIREERVLVVLVDFRSDFDGCLVKKFDGSDCVHLF